MISCLILPEGLKESMRQAELNNWSLEPTQMADLCSSINQFFARTGIQPQGAVQPPVCHGSMHPNKPSSHINTGERIQSSVQPTAAIRCVVTRSCLLFQETCTWIRDRAWVLWWVHRAILTCPPWAAPDPLWQVRCSFSVIYRADVHSVAIH